MKERGGEDAEKPKRFIASLSAFPLHLGSKSIEDAPKGDPACLWFQRNGGEDLIEENHVQEQPWNKRPPQKHSEFVWIPAARDLSFSFYGAVYSKGTWEKVGVVVRKTEDQRF